MTYDAVIECYFQVAWFDNSLSGEYDLNLLVVCLRFHQRVVQQELKPLGRLRRSGFRDVLKGDVDDVESFLIGLGSKQPIGVSRVIPIEETFHFTPEELLKILMQRFFKYADRIHAGESFCVRMERRGLRSTLSSQEVERTLGTYIQNMLKKKFDSEANVNLEDPDKVFVIQTLGNFCGIGLVSKELRNKFPIVRFK